MSKMNFKIFLLILLILLISISLFILLSNLNEKDIISSENVTTQTENIEEKQHDLYSNTLKSAETNSGPEVIKNLLPNIENFHTCYYRMSSLENDSDIPGPSPTIIAGYLYFSDEDMSKIKNDYEWEPYNEEIEFTFIPNEKISTSDIFETSSDFDEKVKPIESIFNAYACFDKGYIYFECLID